MNFVLINWKEYGQSFNLLRTPLFVILQKTTELSTPVSWDMSSWSMSVTWEVLQKGSDIF